MPSNAQCCTSKLISALVFLVLLVWPFSYETVWAVMYLVFTAIVAWYAWKWPRNHGQSLSRPPLT
jgi:hypothetical protein